MEPIIGSTEAPHKVFLITTDSLGKSMIEIEHSGDDKVWISDDEHIWLCANVLDSNEDSGELTVITPSSEKTLVVLKSSTHPVDSTHLNDLDNLCEMNNLHDAPLLDLLRRRLINEQIYTFSGVVLISLNPYKTIPGLYSEPLRFFGVSNDFAVYSASTAANSKDTTSSLGHSSYPHVYHIANQALKNLIHTKPPSFQQDGEPGRNEIKLNQSIIVSGESGAGKTEASKHVMNFLIAANKAMQNINNSNEDKVDDTFAENLTAVLTQSSLIFESFGNAKTVRNDNSSRFGKYIKLKYNPSDYTLMSAVTETFLLEKSRLVSVGQNERNYHIFYQLLRGLPSVEPGLCAALNLKTEIEKFHILTAGNCTTITTVEDDIAEFHSTHQALHTIHCSEDEIQSIYTLLATILHIGNMVFSTETVDDQETTVIDTPTVEIATLASFIGVTEQEFVRCLTTQQMVIAKRSSINVKILSLEDTRNNSQALMKYIYSKLFNWLVAKINLSHSSVEINSKSRVFDEKMSKFIGILDIFGFEILTQNSFEQLCINFTNERLQQQFNEHVFVTEQEIYRAEGLNWSSISFQDNQNVIDLISKKPSGLLYILEEHGMMNRKPDDNLLLNAFHQAHDKPPPPPPPPPPSSGTAGAGKEKIIVKLTYARPRLHHDSFVVKHFAGEVLYTIDGFLVKNNDSLQDDLLELLACCENVFLRHVIGAGKVVVNGPGYLPGMGDAAAVNTDSNNNEESPVSPVSSPLPTGSHSSSRRSPMAPTSGKKLASSVTVSYQFRSQLDSLVSTLRSTNPHYIKCIKPNTSKSADLIQSNIVMEQLRYSGVLEVVRIRREGFPLRVPFRDFYRDYSVLCFHRRFEFKSTKECTSEEAKEYCRYIAETSLDANLFQIGHNLVFLRDGALQALQNAVKFYLARRAATLQGIARTRQCVKRYVSSRACIVMLQSLARRMLKRREFKHTVSMIDRLQRFYKTRHLRRVFVAKYQAILLHRLQTKSASLIQRYYKTRMARRKFVIKYTALLLFRLQMKSATIIQRIFKARRARRKFVAHYEALQLQRLREAAAVFIQYVYRGHHGRVTVKNLRILRATTLVQRVVRGHRDRVVLHNMRRLRAAIRLQSMFRMVPKYRYHRQCITKVTGICRVVRKLQALQKYRKTRRAVIRIQRYFMKARRQRELKTRITALHKMAVEGGERNNMSVKQHLQEYPTDRDVRNKWNNYCTLLQSAALGCNLSVLTSMSVKPADLFVVDSLGQNILHYLAQSPSPSGKDSQQHQQQQQQQCLQFLCHVLNTYKLSHDQHDINQLGYLDDDNDDNILPSFTNNNKNKETTPGTAPAVDFKNMFLPSNSKNVTILKTGWLKKKRGGFMWQKRWAILSEDHIVYFKDANNLSNPKFAIPLDGCTITRLAGAKEPILEITSPFMGEKKGLFSTSNKKTMCFLAESEKDLQEWLVPLKAVAGVESFRGVNSTTPVNYIQTELLQLWLKSTTNNGDTVLHILAKHHNNNTGTNGVFSKTDLSRDDVVTFTAWLIAYGCDVNAVNEAGQTALHVALLHNTCVEFVSCLLLRGADITDLRDCNDKSVTELLIQLSHLGSATHSRSNSIDSRCSSNSHLTTPLVDVDTAVYELIMYASQSITNPIMRNTTTNSRRMSNFSTGSHNSTSNNNNSPLTSPANKGGLTSSFSSPTSPSPTVSVSIFPDKAAITTANGREYQPVKLKGYSYLSLYFKDSTGAIFLKTLTSSPTITVSVYNSKQQKIEESRDVTLPVVFVEGSPIVQWCTTWFMQTPLENIENGTFILVEFSHQSGGNNTKNGGSASPNASLTVVDNNNGLYWCVYPIIFDRIDSLKDEIVMLQPYPLHLDSIGAVEKVNAILNRKKNTESLSVAALTVDVVLSQKSRNVEVKDVLNSSV